MKKVLVWLCLVGLVLALTVCQQPTSPANEAASEVDAGARTSEMINLIVESRATGDFTELEAMLAEDDSEGELRQILADQGVFSAATPKQVNLLPLPSFTPEDYANGDVLVSRGSGGLTSTLMALILSQGYGHAGILNLDLAASGACILSADVDYLTGEREAAVNYETYSDWRTSNDIITVLGYEGPGSPEGIGQAIADLYGSAPGTIYAFLGYPGASVGAFEPIEKGDEKYWYCSKVPWRVYNALPPAGTIDIEASGFYGQLAYDGGPQRWELFKNSVMYKIYLFYLKLQHPWWPLRWIVARADNGLWYAGDSILKELVSPDELRASPLLSRRFTVDALHSGPYHGDDAPVVGWIPGTYEP